MDDKIQKIVSLYRAGTNLTQDEFAAALTEKLTDTLTGAAVSYWERGEREPQTTFCFKLMTQYPANDWRCELGTNLLASIIPRSFVPVGRIGRHVLLGEPLELEEEKA